MNGRTQRLVTLGAMLGVALMVAALIAAHPAAAPRASAQAPLPAAKHVEATLYTDVVQWRTIPSARTVVELRDDGDQVVGYGTGLADDVGDVTVVIRARGGGLRPQPGQPNRATPAIRPGYELRLTHDGGDTVAVTVPDLGIGASTAGDQVLMRGPAGESAALTIEAKALGPIQETITFDGGGRAAYAMPEGAALAPDDSGAVSIDTADDNTFHARFDVLSADVTVGARQVGGAATLGASIELELTASDGSAKGSGGGEVLADPAYLQPQGRDQRTFGPIEVGDTLRVTQSGGLDGTDRTLVGVVAAVTVDVNLGANTVEGEAPADALIRVVVTSPYGETYERETMTDANGNFAVEMSGIDDFGRGWTAAATYEPAPGMRISAFKTVEQVRVGVHSSVVNGVAEPGSLITITVRAADGSEKATSSTRVGRAGTYATGFIGEDERIAVGDSVEVAFVFGDPVSVYVSEVSARTDPDRDTVSGDAAAGASVRASQGAGNSQRFVTTEAGADGDYVADFAGVLDVVAPMNGDLVVRLESGHELFTTWAAVQMTMELGRSFVTGNGPADRFVTAELLSEEQVVVATGAAEVFLRGGGPGGPTGPSAVAGTPAWDLDFEDTLGAEVDIMPGDTVRATVGDDSFEVVVPPLSGVAFVEDDLVNGQTSPGRSLTLRAQHVVTGETTYVDVVADADGNFSHQFGDDFDLQHNDAILLSTLEQGHIVNSRFFVPGIRLDLDTGLLTGSWRPDAEVAYQLRGAAGVRSSGTTTTDADAVFRVLLEDDRGERVVPETGDALTIEPLSGAPEAPLELVVPVLTITWDVDADEMGGRAEPGGHLAFYVRDAIERGLGGPERRRADPDIAADGTYEVTYLPPYNLQPGTEMQAVYRLASGHIVVRTRITPLLNVQHGGANVCGFSAPRSPVSATLLDTEGDELALAETITAYNSRFATALFDEDDEMVRTAVSQTVRASLGADDVELTLPRLVVRVDWDTGRVQGQGPPRSTFTILRPARGCLDADARSLQRGRTNQTGAFQGIAREIDPGEGFEIAFIVDDGHRFYRHVFRSLGQVYVHRDRVTGRATPLSAVAVELVTTEGDVKGAGQAVSDSNGWYDISLRDDLGNEVTSEPGDTILLSASGENPRIEVEELQLDWSLGEPIVGIAPPDREVRISIAFDDGPPARFTLVSSEQGDFRFDESDVPPRSEWGLDDVRGVEAVIDTPNGHEIIYVAGAEVPGPGPGETPEPPSRGHTIYAPRVAKSG